MTNFEELSRFIGFTPKFLGIIPSFQESFHLNDPDILKILIKQKILVLVNASNNPYSIDSYMFEEKQYTVNTDLIDEMYNWYKARMIHKNTEYGHLPCIEEISLKIDQCFDYNEKIDKLKKYHKKYAKELQHELLMSHYLHVDSNLDVDKEKLIIFIKQSLGEKLSFILTYLSKEVPDLNGFGTPYEGDTIGENNSFLLNCWPRILIHDKVLSFIRSELDKLKNGKNINTTKSKNTELTLSQSLILLERIRNIPADTWDNIDYSKRSRIIGKLINKSSENIRKKIPLFDKQNSSLPNQFLADQDFVDLILKEILS